MAQPPSPHQRSTDSARPLALHVALAAAIVVVVGFVGGCNQKDPAPSPYNSQGPVTAEAVD